MSDLILTIKSTDSLRRLVRLTLEYEGFEVAEAANGAEGLAAALRQTPDLILLGGTINGLSGIDICRLLSAEPRLAGVPMVMLSACEGEAERAAAVAAGAVAFVVKPFDPQALVELAHDLIEH